MIKIIIPSILVTVLGIAGYMNKDLIHEKYLQSQVNKNISIESGSIQFCGHPIRDTETPEQLIERVGKQFNGPKTYKKISNTVNKILADTPEIEQLNDKISDWGLQDDEFLEEQIATNKSIMRFDKSSYWKESVDKYTKIQEYRKSAEFTKDELLSERDKLREILYNDKEKELTTSLTNIFEQAACELNDDSLVEKVGISIFHENLSKTEMAKAESLTQKHIKLNTIAAIEPLEAFTKKFAKFINDVVQEIKVITSKTEVDPEYGLITNTLTVVSTNAFGKKQRFDLGCEAGPSQANPIFGSAQALLCFIKRPGDTYDENLYLFGLHIFVEEYDDPIQWNNVKNKLLEQLD